MNKSYSTKKILSLLLALAMLLSTAACGRTDNTPQTSGQSPADASSQDPEASLTDGASQNTETFLPDASQDPEASVPGDASHSVPASSEPAPGAEQPEYEVQYPVTLTDQAGREVTLASQPKRLVSGYYISTSLLIALNLEDNIVGIEAKADSRPIYKLSAPALLDLPNVGSAKEFDLEGCAALEPDLVILPIKLKSAAETLTELGFPVLLVNPENQEMLTETIHLIAKATNTQAQAQALLDFTAAQEERLSGLLGTANSPTVYLAGNSSLLSTAGNAMYQSDLIRRAGGINAAAEITDAYWAEIDYERLLHWNPDYIILASDAAYTVEDVLTDPNLADCAAVAEGNVYQMPGKAESWDSPVPGSILGIVWLSGILHPDLCPETDNEAIINEYYENFYGFLYSEN